MTVQELIDSLNKIKDKSSVVYYYTAFGDYYGIDDIEDHEDNEVILFGGIMSF